MRYIDSFKCDACGAFVPEFWRSTAKPLETCPACGAPEAPRVPAPNASDGHYELSCWFGLSYASFLTLPRVFMEAMPDEWQGRMAALLNEYGAAFPNQPDLGTRVQVTDGDGHLIKAPRWLIEYRHPDRGVIDACRRLDSLPPPAPAIARPPTDVTTGR